MEGRNPGVSSKGVALCRGRYSKFAEFGHKKVRSPEVGVRGALGRLEGKNQISLLTRGIFIA
jgi:hypothetical protein